MPVVKTQKRKFETPIMTAFKQKEIFFKIYPFVNEFAKDNATKGRPFDDDVLIRLLTYPATQEIREWLEEQLMDGVKEKKSDGKLHYTDIESFKDEVFTEYLPLLVEILKVNFKDFFCSLKKDADEIASAIQAHARREMESHSQTGT